jgi:hypothetical protein
LELERLIATLELRASQFHGELDRVERELRRTDQASRGVTTQMRTSFRGRDARITALRVAIAGLTNVLAVRDVLA